MKKTLACIFAALLIASSLFSCSSGGKAGNAETAAGETSETLSNSMETASDTGDTTVARAHNVLDNLDFGGEDFHTYYLNWQGHKFYFFADEQNGDVMNDSIYTRKTKVEEELNVVITQEGEDDYVKQTEAIKKTTLAGEDAYDQALIHCIYGVAELSSGGYLYNLDSMPHLDFTADWWNREQMDVLRLGKNTYYGISDYMIPCPYVVFFNKELTENYGMENPYQLVYDGTWTFDTFSSMAQSAVSDINGDGSWTIDDQYGVTANEISKYISFMSGADQFITQKDSEGKIELAMNTEKTVKLVETFAALYGKNVCYMPKSMKDADQLTINTGRMLFQLDAISEAVKMRDYEVDFGFLPYPKYDEKQDGYRSLDWGGLCCVPATISNPEMVGAVTELLAFYSAETVIPTYYDVLLTGKLARDDDTVKMMDILFDTICYEVGGNYFGFSDGFSDLFFTIGRLSLAGKSDFSSWYASKESASQKTVENFYKALETAEA